MHLIRAYCRSKQQSSAENSRRAQREQLHNRTIQRKPVTAIRVAQATQSRRAASTASATSATSATSTASTAAAASNRRATNSAGPSQSACTAYAATSIGCTRTSSRQRGEEARVERRVRCQRRCSCGFGHRSVLGGCHHAVSARGGARSELDTRRLRVVGRVWRCPLLCQCRVGGYRCQDEAER